ncbi:MAG: hypothetical protein ABMA64_33455, partial [Myxococcota bacterium]
MTRLFFQIYLAFLGVITVSVGVSAVLSAVVFDRPVMRTTEEAAAVVAAVAASPDVDLEQLLAGSRWEATLYAADGAKLGSEVTVRSEADGEFDFNTSSIVELSNGGFALLWNFGVAGRLR